MTAFDENGAPVPSCDFQYPDGEATPDEVASAQREIFTRADTLKVAIAAREEGFRAGLEAAMPEARRQVVAELVQGHKEPSSALSRVAGAAVRLGLMPVQDAARWAGKSVRMIRHAAANMAL